MQFKAFYKQGVATKKKTLLSELERAADSLGFAWRIGFELYTHYVYIY